MLSKQKVPYQSVRCFFIGHFHMKKTPPILPVVFLNLERKTGIEPACSAWEADILPLNYSRKF